MVSSSSSAAGVSMGRSADSGLNRIGHRWKQYVYRHDDNYKQLNHDGLTIEHSDRNSRRHDAGHHCWAVHEYARNNAQPEHHCRNRHNLHDSRSEQEYDRKHWSFDSGYDRQHGQLSYRLIQRQRHYRSDDRNQWHEWVDDRHDGADDWHLWNDNRASD